MRVGTGVALVTGLLTSNEKDNTSAALGQESNANLEISLHRGIWFAFVLGAAIGAASIFRFEALGILGIGVPLAATMIASCVMSK